MSGHRMGSPMEVNILFARTCMLTPCGYAFRRPLKLRTVALSFAAAFCLVVGEVAQYKLLKNKSDSKLFSLDELSSWALSILVAAYVDWYLRGFSTAVSYGLSASCALLTLLQLVSASRRRSVLPHISGRSSTFFWTFTLLLLLPSRRSLQSFRLNQYAEDALVFIRAGFQAVREHHAPTDNPASEHDASSQSGHTSNSPEYMTDQHSRMDVPIWTTQIVYKRLVDQQIRLLRQQATSVPGLYFELVTYTSLSSLSYTAVSYCWGKDLSGTKQIYINGSRVNISSMLYKTLEDVVSFCNGPFWLDAININLADLIERSTQVLRMADIYQTADQVVACVESTDSEDDSCLRMMSFFESMSDVHGDLQVDFPSDKASFDDLRNFVDQPYWKRLWIIQEIAMARKDGVSLVACNKRVPLHRFSDLLLHVDKQPPQQEQWPQFLQDMQHIRQILEIRERRQSGRPVRLLQTLVRTQRAKSKFKHDKVFGLLSLVTDFRDFVTDPDYTLSKTDICKAMTRRYIDTNSSLDIILAGTCTTNSSSHLPSWCPDYLQLEHATLDGDFVRYLSGEDERHRMGNKCQKWETTGTVKSRDTKLPLSFNDEELILNGLQVDSVDGLSATSGQRNGSEEDQFIFARQNTNVATPRKLSVGNHKESTYDGICRMLLIYDERYSEYTKKSIVLGMLYNVAYIVYATGGGRDADTVWKWLNKNRKLMINGKTLRDRAFYSWDRVIRNYVSSVFMPSAKTMTVMDYPRITASVAGILHQELRLMVTSGGSIGWINPRAHLGDEIFLFEGCSLPVVLRPVVPDGGLSDVSARSSAETLNSTYQRHRHTSSASNLNIPSRHQSLETSNVLMPRYKVVGYAIVDGCMDGKRWASRKEADMMRVVIV